MNKRIKLLRERERPTSMDQQRNLLGQPSLGVPQLRRPPMLHHQRLDFRQRHKRQQLQQSLNLRVRRPDEKLIQRKRRRLRLVQPHSIPGRLTELVALLVRDYRQRHPKHRLVRHSTDQLMAGHQIAHLITAAQLEGAFVLPEQVQPVEGLEDLVGEFGEAHSRIAVQPRLD